MSRIYIPEMEAKAHSPQVMADAEHWFVRMRAGDCSAGERLDFDQWRQNPEHAAALAATQQIWRSIDGLKADAAFRAMTQKVLSDTSPYPVRRRHLTRWQWSAAAAVGAATIGLAAFAAVKLWTQDVVYTTEAGERSTVKLSDGSEVILNSATTLHVQFGAQRRKIILNQGEALFSVAQDANRPFTVSAGQGDVTALGTRFQVRTEPKQDTVTLLEGLVAVERDGDSVRMAPGEQIRLRADSRAMDRRRVDPDVVASWSTGRLLFRYTPLVDVVEEVNRYSAAQILIEDRALEGARISGTFEIGDSASVITAIQAIFPVDVAREGAHEFRLRQRQ